MGDGTHYTTGPTGCGTYGAEVTSIWLDEGSALGEVAPRREKQMGKRFEDVHAPVLTEMLLAYELFRMEDALGAPGRNTAFAYACGREDEHLVFHTLPGEWREDDLSGLIRDAYGGVATPVRAQAA